MEDLNSRESVGLDQGLTENPISGQEPVKKNSSSKKIFWVIIAVVIFLVLIFIGLAIIGAQPTDDFKELTGQEKQELIEALEQNPGPELTNEERFELVEALDESANQAPELSLEEKQNLIEALNQ
ncbi:MAG: hypothetical protein WCX70_00825 [Candidatus Paceibacterota bacterium]|jgi:flagellar biosynthesis/type III secretory pathway M-ring protein FliF/YscJ